MSVEEDGGGYSVGTRDERQNESTLDDAITTLRLYIVQALATHAEEVTLLHAGAVEWNGRSILFPGESHTGKTRMTQALSSGGAGYLSDEYAPVDNCLEVIAWPRPLGLREHERLGPGRHVVEDLGGRRAELPSYPIGAVYLLHWDETVESLETERLSPPEALLRLLPYSFSARTPALLDRLARLVDAVPVFQGRRGEADIAANELLTSRT